MDYSDLWKKVVKFIEKTVLSATLLRANGIWTAAAPDVAVTYARWAVGATCMQRCGITNGAGKAYIVGEHFGGHGNGYYRPMENTAMNYRDFTGDY